MSRGSGEQPPGYSAQFLNGRQRYDEAIVWAKGAIAQHDYGVAHETLSEAYAGQAAVALEKNDLRGCAALIEEALRADPRCAEAHYVRGVYLRRTGDERAAVAEFEAALRSEPDHARAKLALGAKR